MTEKSRYLSAVAGTEVDVSHWKCGRCGKVFGVFELGQKLIKISEKVTISHPIHALCCNETVTWEKWDEELNQPTKNERQTDARTLSSR